MNTLHTDGREVSAFERWMAHRRLRHVSRLGLGARVKGYADIGGGGKIVIGSEFFLLSQPVRSHILAAPGAVITIGDGVQISYGAALAAQRAIDIGGNTVFGPFVVIMDNDFHRVGDRSAAGEVAPVRIGSNVSIGARVTILRGSDIGDNVRIMSGSMVSGVVPSGVTIGGVPARVVASNGSAEVGVNGMAKLVQGVLGLVEAPHHSDGPEQIPAWDSLGALRLLLAIEEAHAITLGEDEMRAANSIADLSDIVEARIERSRAIREV